MKKIYIFLITNLVLSCQSPNMDFKITQQQTLENVPSASGIVKIKNGYFVIGDDSPFLFRLDENLDTVAHYRVHSSSAKLENGRIPKKNKPDFEALEMASENEMIAFGSGSKSPQRDVFIKMKIGDAISVEEYSLTTFYDALRGMEILKDSELNIEAAAFHGDVLYLFNRRKNVIFRVNYLEFLAHVENNAALPDIDFSAYTLPEMNGIEAGFSGAAISGSGKMIVTASVEDTDNAYDDGEVLGSFIGVASLEDGNDISGVIEWLEIGNREEALKVESVCVDRENSEKDFDVILVTDSDGGESLVLKGNLKW